MLSSLWARYPQMLISWVWICYQFLLISSTVPKELVPCICEVVSISCLLYRVGGMSVVYVRVLKIFRVYCGFCQGDVHFQRTTEEDSKHMQHLRDSMIKAIQSRIPHVRLNGHEKTRLPNNVNIEFQACGR
jgi:hypothetical protein